MMLTVNRSQFTVRYPFTVIREALGSRANGKCTVNSKWLIANRATGGSVL